MSMLAAISGKYCDYFTKCRVKAMAAVLSGLPAVFSDKVYDHRSKCNVTGSSIQCFTCDYLAGSLAKLVSAQQTAV